MAEKPEVNSEHESDVGACAELAFDDSSSATLLPSLDSADIIPEAAMKCGILPLDGDTLADLSDNVTTENMCLYLNSFWVTVCKTVRPMLSVRCLYVCLSVLCVCLSVTFAHCGQTVERIKMKLGVQVGLDPGHIVLDGDPAPPPAPNFRPISVAAKWLHGSRYHLVWS